MFEPKTVKQNVIIEALNDGATVITANKRLANVTRQNFEKANIENQLQVWQTPEILPLDTWLQTLWDELVISNDIAIPELLLSSQQELQLWKNIIQAESDNPLLQINTTAREAQQAWQLVHAWQLEFDQYAFSNNSDSAEYFKWATAFKKKCLQNNWLSSAQLIDVLQNELANRSLTTQDFLPPNKDLIIFGFDELPPQLQQFLTKISDAGSSVNWFQLEGLSGKQKRLSCSDFYDEADCAARWVYQCIKDKPDARVGVVVPDLQSKRHIVTQVFDRVLLPQSLNPTLPDAEKPYNISLGLSLASYPIIKVALNILQLLLPTVRLQVAGSLLHSPFIRGWQNEASARALLDAWLRNIIGEFDVSLNTIKSAAHTDKNHACPILVKNIDALKEEQKKCGNKLSAGQWAEKIAILLRAFGWAEGRELSSEEYQQTEAWQNLLISFSTLEAVTDDMSAVTAISLINSLAQDRTYQPQTNDLPIQILGVLESSEMQFDYLWVMGLHDGVWPPAPRANPFLPITMQRKAGLPHSSESWELRAAQRITQRLLNSALSTVTVSYPKRDGDNELRVSALIKNITEVFVDKSDNEATAIKLIDSKPWVNIVHESATLEILKDETVPAIIGTTVLGGSSVLKHQANCPFRAFAEFRLGARMIEEPAIGLNAKEKGKLLHKILEKTWNLLKTQESLLAMEPSNLERLVLGISKEAVDNAAKRLSQTFTNRYKAIESERLCSRVMEWLVIEKERPVFKVIESEKEHSLEVAKGVHINIVVDRIDELADGKKLVVDYKTGSVNTRQWFGDRPEDPQLPLYSTLADENIAAIAFAQVRVNEMKFMGVAEEADLLSGVKSFEQINFTSKETWTEVLQDWQQSVQALAVDFRDGVATIDPLRKDNLHTCENTYCKLKPLCRIDELVNEDNKISKKDSVQ